MGTYGIILTCRNSEKCIEPSIYSLIEQSIKPEYIIIIDDGSKDQTPKIIREIQSVNKNIYVITNPDMGYDIGRVVTNWNKAIKFAKKEDLKPTEYHMIAPDDAKFERDYCKKIINKMDNNPKICVASGNYDNNEYHFPRGAGRFIRNSFFNTVYNYYPEKMGYETIIFYSAIQNGFKCVVVPEARYIHTRKLGSNHHFYEFGASMRTLGYHPLFVLGRFVKYLISGKPIGRIGSIYMGYYYLTYMPKKEGYESMFDVSTRKHIRKIQTKRIMKYIKIIKK